LWTAWRATCTWECWHDAEGAPVESCTILTTGSNELIRPFPERMPVILAPGDFDT
jgi:putative SOS response-associated peptidase YedK